jgi:hypothetical protein
MRRVSWNFRSAGYPGRVERTPEHLGDFGFDEYFLLKGLPGR